MYGLINRGIKDFALAQGGEALWNNVRHRAGLDVDTFISMDAYPDELTYGLVQAASEELAMDPAVFLEQFGEYWVLYTGQEGYGPVMDAAGNSLEEFLGNLDGLHARVRLSMPDLKPPGFSCTVNPDGGCTVAYYSTRQGLEPLVVGLLKGLGRRFDTPVSVRAGGRSRDNGTVLFHVTYTKDMAA